LELKHAEKELVLIITVIALAIFYVILEFRQLGIVGVALQRMDVALFAELLICSCGHIPIIYLIGQVLVECISVYFFG
jgi:hypothetical protein